MAVYTCYYQPWLAEALLELSFTESLADLPKLDKVDEAHLIYWLLATGFQHDDPEHPRPEFVKQQQYHQAQGIIDAALGERLAYPRSYLDYTEEYVEEQIDLFLGDDGTRWAVLSDCPALLEEFLKHVEHNSRSGGVADLAEDVIPLLFEMSARHLPQWLFIVFRDGQADDGTSLLLASPWVGYRNPGLPADTNGHLSVDGDQAGAVEAPVLSTQAARAIFLFWADYFLPDEDCMAQWAEDPLLKGEP